MMSFYSRDAYIYSVEKGKANPICNIKHHVMTGLLKILILNQQQISSKSTVRESKEESKQNGMPLEFGLKNILLACVKKLLKLRTELNFPTDFSYIYQELSKHLQEEACFLMEPCIFQTHAHLIHTIHFSREVRYQLIVSNCS